MKKVLAIIATFALAIFTTAAPKQQLTTKMLYHNGPLLTGTQNLYVIYYGCSTDNCGPTGDIRIRDVFADFMIYLGNTPYAQINSTYTDAAGQHGTSSFILGGEVVDGSYSHGTDLTQSDMVSLISKHINSFRLPHDTNGIYVIITSADIASITTGFCSPSVPPLHGQGCYRWHRPTLPLNLVKCLLALNRRS